MIYLDNAASTPVLDEVAQEMIPFFNENYGNPSSIHKLGRKAHYAIQNARKQVANLVNADPDEIFFTSGGTESNNCVLNGFARQGKHIITSSVEHEAVLEPCKSLEKKGYKVTYLPVNSEGMVDPDDVKKSITKDTCLVSIMFANNEVGTIQPIDEIAKICNENKVPLHSDAVQAIGKIPIDLKELHLSAMSISSHKINGPKGIGAIYLKKGLKIEPFVLGGGQEDGMRSGTENVAGIVGFGKACQIAKSKMQQNISHMKCLRDNLVENVLREIPHTTINGHNKKRVPNNAHFTFLGVNGEDLIIKLDENGIAASTGSACSVRVQKASHVLKAMGFSHEQITGSLRLTVGILNTEKEIESTVDILKKVVRELREVSPLKAKYGF